MQQSFLARSEASTLGNSEDRGPLIVIINGTVTAFATAIVALRFVSRAVIVKRLGSDDWTMVLATVTAILNVVIAGLGVKYGTGKHDGTISKANALPAAKLRYVTHIIYTLITGLIKTSICLLYLRLFPNLRNITLGTIAFVGAMSIAIILATIFQCSPVDAVYNPHKYDRYTCFASIPFCRIIIRYGFMDPRFTNSNHLRAISSACIASIVRMVYIVKLYQSSDPSWSTFGVSVSSGIEVAVAIIAASLPSTKPVIDLLFPRLFSTTATAEKSHTLTTSQRAYVNRASGRSHRQHDEISLVHLTVEFDRGKGDSSTTLTTD
ncbi:hypothetical protein AbraIFM66950_004732 [Aspergillus brasiliensis]|nr:hypothetical protein AbraIFM66950_004732 [Aspergillus brasiliensis]